MRVGRRCMPGDLLAQGHPEHPPQCAQMLHLQVLIKSPRESQPHRGVATLSVLLTPLRSVSLWANGTALLRAADLLLL